MEGYVVLSMQRKAVGIIANAIPVDTDTFSFIWKRIILTGYVIDNDALGKKSKKGILFICLFKDEESFCTFRPLVRIAIAQEAHIIPCKVPS